MPAPLLSLFIRTIPGFSISSGGPSAREAHMDIVLLDNLIYNPIHTVRHKNGYLMNKSRLKGQSHELDILIQGSIYFKIPSPLLPGRKGMVPNPEGGKCK
jgi:hypothetical protein